MNQPSDHDAPNSQSVMDSHLTTWRQSRDEGAQDMNTRIMYIESKSNGLTGPARIGSVTFSKSGRTLYYRGHAFRSLKGKGFKANYFEVESGAQYWISGPRKDGADRLYGESDPVEIDEDVRQEYWRDLRGLPNRANESVANR